MNLIISIMIKNGIESKSDLDNVWVHPFYFSKKRKISIEWLFGKIKNRICNVQLILASSNFNTCQLYKVSKNLNEKYN